MAFRKMEEFVGQRSEYPFPDDLNDPKLKQQKDYYLAYCRAMIADYTNNHCMLPFTFGEGKRTFKELHEYATGTYPNSKLKDNIIGTKKKKNGKWITKLNISWDTLPVVSKMLDIMREKNMKQDYDIDCYCVDDDSIQAKEADKAMLKYLVSADAVEIMRRTGFKPNVKIDPQQIGIMTEQDVDLYFEVGAYVFERELATIAACNKTKLLSKYKVVQDGTFDDLIKYAIAVWKTDIDPTTKVPKIRKCSIYNPELGFCPTIIPYSSTNNFEGMSRGAEIVPMTIKDIRQKYPKFKAAELIELAECYSYLNPEYQSLISAVSTSVGPTEGYNLDPINRCKVLVLDCQWLGVDIENYLENPKTKLYKEVPFDYEVNARSERKGDRINQKRVVKKYSAQWVIGSDVLLEYGPCKDVIYYGPDGDRCPGIDFFATKTGSISLIERTIAIQDDIDLANIKLRSAISSAIPAPRMVIQTGLLDNVYLNGIKQQPEDNFATFKELGYLTVNAVDDDGKPIFTNQKLVDFLPMGITEDINVFTGQILSGINNLREVLGIAQGADGSTPQKYDGAKKTELAAASSNAALYPTFNCFQYLFEDGFNDIGKKWQIVAKDNDVKVNYSPLGQKNMKVLSLDDKFTNADLNIVLTLGATDQELAELMADIRQLKALGVQTNFNQGITTAEYIYLSETIRSGNAKQAMWVMAKVEQKKIAAQKAIDEQNQAQNAKSQQDSSAIAEQNKQETIAVSGREDRKTMVLKGALEMKKAVSTAMLNTFDAEKDPSPTALYEQMMKDADSEIIGVLSQDNPQAGQQQQSPDEEAQEQPMAPEMQQQVA